MKPPHSGGFYKNMIQEKKFYLTKPGLEKIEKEYKKLKEVRLAKIKGDSLSILNSEDLNPEHSSRYEDISFLESRINEFENIIKNVELIKKPLKEKQNIIDLGATVTLVEKGGRINEFIITGMLEANPGEGKI